MSAREIFEKLLEEMKINFQEKRGKYYYARKKEAETLEGKTYKEIKKYLAAEYGKYYFCNSDGVARDIDRMLEDREENYLNDMAIKVVRKDIDSYIKERIDDDTKDMFESFLSKQTKKTDDIIKGRNVFVKGRIRDNLLEGDINFILDDGSKFDMRFQVISKYSSQGKFFYQFPTTFHNAFMKNGEQIKNPSEKRLKELL